MEHEHPLSPLQILKRQGCSHNIIKHCEAVASLATQIAQKAKQKNHNICVELVRTAALLHDIGRVKTHDVDHGVVGAQIVRELGLSEEIAEIIERHVGAGFTKTEAEKLGLPARNMVPETLAEKIVAHADNLVDGYKTTSFTTAITRFKKELGSNHPSIKRLEKLHGELAEFIE